VALFPTTAFCSAAWMTEVETAKKDVEDSCLLHVMDGSCILFPECSLFFPLVLAPPVAAQ